MNGKFSFKRMILTSIPVDMVPIQGVAYAGVLDVIVESSVAAPAECVYEAVMNEDRTVTVLKDATAGRGIPAHTFAGWPVPESAKEAALERAAREVAL